MGLTRLGRLLPSEPSDFHNLRDRWLALADDNKSPSSALTFTTNTGEQKQT